MNYKIKVKYNEKMCKNAQPNIGMEDKESNESRYKER